MSEFFIYLFIDKIHHQLNIKQTEKNYNYTFTIRGASHYGCTNTKDLELNKLKESYKITTLIKLQGHIPKIQRICLLMRINCLVFFV